jgi:hypothetical protein
MTHQVSITTILTLIVTAEGCSKPHNHVMPPATSSPVTISVNTPKYFRWTLASKPHSVSFQIADSSIVSVNTDTTKKELPFISNSTYGLSVVPGSPPHIRLHIDSTSDGKKELDLTAIVSPHGQVTDLQAIHSASCRGGINPRFVRLFDLFASPPSTSIAAGSHWTDTSIVVVCHGRTPLRQQIIHSYTLIGESSWRERHILEIQRVTQIEIGEVQVDSQNPVTAKGSGAGLATLLIDPESGLVLQSSGTSDLSLSVITSRGMFPFRQHGVTSIIAQ